MIIKNVYDKRLSMTTVTDLLNDKTMTNTLTHSAVVPLPVRCG